MKKIIVVSFLLICSMHTFGQTAKEVNLIEADSTWRKEIVKVPIWFAPEINYEGYEDVRFAKGWGDMNSSDFWTLAYVWDINLEKKPTATFFEDNLKFYFDGLMGVVNNDDTLIVPKTKAFFIENKIKNEVTTFTGTVEVYDAFATKKPIVLNVTIESYYCSISKKYIPLFRFSPKNFEHKIWEQLNQIQLQDTICKNE